MPFARAGLHHAAMHLPDGPAEEEAELLQCMLWPRVLDLVIFNIFLSVTVLQCQGA